MHGRISAAPDRLPRRVRNPGYLLLAAVLPGLLAAGPAGAQMLSPDDIKHALDTEGRAELGSSGITILAANFPAGADTMEALLFLPKGEGPHPGLLLIPGYARTARDYIPLGVRFSGQGYAGLAVTMPGFGSSGGSPDFCGPGTIRAMEAGLDLLRNHPGVDSTRVGVYGYSRGALAAAVLATRSNRLRAAVLASGIYDLRRAYDDITDEILRGNIREETGFTDDAIRQRSPLLDMESLACPVLILHGGKDQNAPVSQAERLRDRLTELGKPFEIRIFPEQSHGLGVADVLGATLPFLEANLASP